MSNWWWWVSEDGHQGRHFNKSLKPQRDEKMILLASANRQFPAIINCFCSVIWVVNKEMSLKCRCFSYIVTRLFDTILGSQFLFSHPMSMGTTCYQNKCELTSLILMTIESIPISCFYFVVILALGPLVSWCTCWKKKKFLSGLVNHCVLYSNQYLQVTKQSTASLVTTLVSRNILVCGFRVAKHCQLQGVFGN